MRLSICDNSLRGRGESKESGLKRFFVEFVDYLKEFDAECRYLQRKMQRTSATAFKRKFCKQFPMP